MSATIVSMATIVSILGNPFSGRTLVPLLFAIIAVVFLLSSVRRRLRQRQQEPDRESAQREPPHANPKQRLRRDLENLIVELQELSREISAQIDTRFAKLEAAMRDADRRIAVLNRLARQLAEHKGERPPEPEDHDARHAVVYELADAGLSPVEIAKDLGKTPGEVELILKLRRQDGSRAGGPAGSTADGPR